MLQVPKLLTILVISKWWYINSTQQTQRMLWTGFTWLKTNKFFKECLMFMGHEFKLDPRYQMFRDYEFLQTAIVLSNKSPLLPHTPHPFLINWSNHTGLYKSIFLFYLKTINNITVYGINGRWIQAWSTDGKVTYSETVPTTLCPSQIPHRLPKNQTQISTVRSRWLPQLWHSFIV